MQELRILHLVGSAYDDFYCGASLRYGQCCMDNLAKIAASYDFLFAYVTPDGRWRFPRSLNSADIDASKAVPLTDAIQFMLAQKIDLMIPHMYCIPGMTHYRALFDLLDIPYLGNAPDVMAITAHKSKTKAIVATAGVRVPEGELLRRGETPTIAPPVIVKPADADNSLGMTLVKDVSQYEAALKKAFEHSNEVLVERFIAPGREFRCAVLVKDGELLALPLEEYLVESQKKPVRTFEDKFPELDADGNFIGWPEYDSAAHRMTDLKDPIIKKVQEIAKKCHLALNCRHYSMFEFRADPDGEPWFIEAGLYCSFGAEGGMSLMAETAGISLKELFETMINEARKAKH